MESKNFHFVKYEFGTVEAEDGQEAGQMAAHPLAPKKSKVLIIVSQKVGTPVFPNLEHQELIDRIAHLETVIIWKVEHFEKKAKTLENQAGHSLFDRDKFMIVLYEMINNHNRDEGISWSTVERYLTEFCKKD
jgi:helix-turn-helix protein